MTQNVFKSPGDANVTGVELLIGGLHAATFYSRLLFLLSCVAFSLALSVKLPSPPKVIADGKTLEVAYELNHLRSFLMCS